MTTLYRALYESTMSYGLIHLWGASCHMKPVKVLQNKVCWTIQSMHKRTSEAVIYDKMGVLRLEDLYQQRLAIFVLYKKNRLPGQGILCSVALWWHDSTYPKWLKVHSRMQSRYKGADCFNKLTPQCREEKAISKLKKGLPG